MVWICPTFQRPHRLQELAESWDRMERGKELYVRLWSGDPKLKEYRAITWPKNWRFYVSDAGISDPGAFEADKAGG